MVSVFLTRSRNLESNKVFKNACREWRRHGVALPRVYQTHFPLLFRPDGNYGDMLVCMGTLQLTLATCGPKEILP